MPAELATTWWLMVLTATWVCWLVGFCVELWRSDWRHTDPWPPGDLAEMRRSLQPPVPLVLAPLRLQPTYPDYDGWPVGNPQRQIGGAT